MFKMIDTDGSGHITLEELKKGLERVGANLKDYEINGLMQAVSVCFKSYWKFIQAVRRFSFTEVVCVGI